MIPDGAKTQTDTFFAARADVTRADAGLDTAAAKTQFVEVRREEGYVFEHRWVARVVAEELGRFRRGRAGGRRKGGGRHVALLASAEDLDVCTAVEFLLGAIANP